MELKVGQRLKSQACSTNMIVIKAPAGDIDLRCGGSPMATIDADESSHEVDPEFASGSAVGKRYGDGDLELLCTKPGAGSLSIGSAAITVLAAKDLPSSD